MCFRSAIWCLTAALVAVLLLGQAQAQSVIQSGPAFGGHAPMYENGPGQGFAAVMDSGKASGGPIGQGLSEMLMQAVNPNGGSAIAPSSGSGPYGTHNCMWDTYATNPAGAHYLCVDPDAQGGALIAIGAIGLAAQQPVNCLVNGVMVTNCLTQVGSVPCAPTVQGLVPATGGTTSNFLRSDCSFTNTLTGQFKVGNPGWLNAINPCTETCAATSSLSNTGQIGVIGAGKTSDAGTTATNAIGVLGYAWNNNTTTAEQGYGVLAIGRHDVNGLGGGNATLAVEADAVENRNWSNANFIGPYAMGPATANLSVSFWAASGDGFDLPVYPASAAMGVIANGSTFLSGIVIASTALFPRDSGGHGRAIDMAATQVIHWDNPSPGMATSLWADTAGLHGGGNIGSQTVPTAPAVNTTTEWVISNNFTNSDVEVDFWNNWTAPGARVFSFRKKDTATTQVELASINFGGELRMIKGAFFAAPGAGYGMLQWGNGTTSGSCALFAYAGTSSTPVRVVDNVGSGC